MTYTWSKKELIIKRWIAKLLNNHCSYEQISNLLDLIDISDSTVKLDDLILFEREEFNFESAKRYFTSGLEYIPENIYERILDIYFWCEDTEALKCKTNYCKLKLSDDDLISIVADLINSLKSPLITKEFNKLLPRFKHIINIQKNNEEVTKGLEEKLGGITLLEPLFKKSYITIFREYTFEDIEALFHECLHAIFFSIFISLYKRDNILFFRELEGSFANIYCSRYFKNTPLASEGNKLRKALVDEIVTQSYLLMTNHLLFRTSSDASFNLDKVNEQLDSLTNKNKIQINSSDLPTLLSIQGFDEITSVISYLVSLDIIESDLPIKSQIDSLMRLKSHDSEALMLNLQNSPVTFYKDNYTNLTKEYNLTRKI